MAVENLYNAIRLTAGDDSVVEAIVTDITGQKITSGNMHLVVPAAKIDVAGVYDNTDKAWKFTLAACALKGKYFYRIMLGTEYLTYDTPIYFE